jgi:type IV pilus assembly protein PilM
MPFWKDPPPSHVFEVSEAGIAHAQGAQVGFTKFSQAALKTAPSEDQLLRVDAAAATLAQLVSPNGNKKRRQAAVLLPDSSARISVLDFDSFPDPADEQLSLVKFRVKKTIPFDIDSAAVAYYRQPGANRKGKIEVVAVTVALEVLARYEALFRNAGFHPGDITISALSALNLYREQEPAIIAKLAESTLTVMVVAGDKLKLFRCVPLETSSEEEVLSVLHPSRAYAEDELDAPVKRLLLCGADDRFLSSALKIEPLRSRFGTPTPFNSGLFGYMEAANG